MAERDKVQTVSDNLDQIIEEIPEERIRLLAYGLWEEEGRPDGRAEDHWNEAARRAQEIERARS